MTMPPPTNHSPIACLILARLLVAGEKGESMANIKKDLEPLLVHRWSGAALSDVLDRTIIDLDPAGLVTLSLGKTRKSPVKLVLTNEGRRQALAFLGVDQLWPKPKPTWNVLRKAYLPASVLGLPASSEAALKTMSSDPVFKAVLLKRHYQLPTAEVPKLEEAIDALLWKLMGFEGETRKFTMKAIKTAVLNRAVGDSRATDFKKAASRLAAQRTGARRDDAKELRDAVLRNWIDRQSQPGITHPQPAPTLLSLPAFAERVQAAARACPTGRYGDNKVFIVHVWRMLQADSDFAGMDLDAFKRRLAEANNARLLDLARADLVQAMDPDDVRLSEVRYLNATFHFIRI
jgi:hypothetical protein